jgi:hypothetical protein
LSVDFRGTAAIVRRALERSFTGVEPGDAVWRGLVGPGQAEVAVHVEPFAHDRAAVRMVAQAISAPELSGTVAEAILLENDALVLGRFRHHDGAVRVEHTLLGGHTLHVQEVRVGAWAVGWAANAFADRLAARTAGRPVDESMPVPAVEARRGAQDRVLSTRERVERFLRQLYGAFETDPAWGYHGGFGSTRVFCNVRHYLETSTVVTVGSPVLSGVAPSPALALDVHAVAARAPFGRFSLAAERGELWFEHVILGDDLDPDELRTAIDAVARTGDAQDDRLQVAYGGRRYADLGAGE